MSLTSDRGGAAARMSIVEEFLSRPVPRISGLPAASPTPSHRGRRRRDRGSLGRHAPARVDGDSADRKDRFNPVLRGFPIRGGRSTQGRDRILRPVLAVNPARRSKRLAGPDPTKRPTIRPGVSEWREPRAIGSEGTGPQPQQFKSPAVSSATPPRRTPLPR
jgi:hypothetical protein